MTLEKKTREMLLNLATSNLSTIAAIFGNLIITPIVARAYTKEQFGTFLLASTIINLLLFTNLGIPQALLRRLATINAASENSEYKFISLEVNSASAPIFLLSIILSTILLILYQGNIIGEALENSSLIVAVIVICYILKLQSDIYDAVIKSTGKYFIASQINAASYLLQILCTMITATWLVSVEYLIITLIIGPAISLGASILYAHKLLNFRISLLFSNYKIFISLLNDSKWYLLSSISVVGIFQANQIIISSQLGVAEFGVYAAMYRFCDIFRIILSNICSIFFQNFTLLHQKRKYREIMVIQKKMYVSFVIIVVLGLSFSYMAGFDIYLRWIGIANSGDYLTFCFLILLSALFGINQISSTILGAMNLHGPTVVVGIMQGLLSILLSLYLLQEHMMMAAVAFSSIVALVLTNLWFNPFYLRKKINEDSNSIA